MITRTRILGCSACFLMMVGWGSVAFGQTTIYWKKDFITDAGGAVIATATPAPSDTVAPDAPTGLTSTALTSTSVELTWTGSQDNSGGSGVAGYKLYRGPLPIGSVSSAYSSFTDNTVQSSMGYSYTVIAFDFAGNHSVSSTAFEVGIPTKPTGLETAYASSQIGLSWTASTDNVSVHHYEVERKSASQGFTRIESCPTTCPGTNAFNDNSVNANQAYVYRVRAVDGDDNKSAWSAVDLATTVTFTDPTLNPNGTRTTMKKEHITELRAAINLVRATAGLCLYGATSCADWTHPTLTSQVSVIDADDIEDMRVSLSTALTTLGFPAPTFTDDPLNPNGTRTSIKKVHIEELRSNVK